MNERWNADGGDGDLLTRDDSRLGVLEIQRTPNVKRPILYNVVLLNDDYTEGFFVVDTLRQFFNLDSEKAKQIMLHVHMHGSGLIAQYPKDIAQSKSDEVNRHAEEHGYSPFLTRVEEASPDNSPSPPDDGGWEPPSP